MTKSKSRVTRRDPSTTKSHASHEHRREAEGAEVLDKVADRLQMIHGSAIHDFTG